MPEFKSQKGQTLLIILMVMGLALAAGVAISSRSIQSLKQTLYSEEASEAFYLAEAGIEDALKKLEDEAFTSNSSNFCDPAFDIDSDPQAVEINLDSAPDTVNDTRICIYKVAGTFDRDNLERDVTYQIPLRDGDPATPDANAIWIHWSGNAIVTYSIISKRGSSASLDHKGLHDPAAADGCDTGGTNDPSGFFSSAEADRYIEEDLSGYGYGVSDEVIMRLRFLCEDSARLVVEGRNGTGAGSSQVALPKQFYRINAKSINKSVVREIEATKSLPALPAIFDYVLFSGSESKPLTK